MRNTLILLSSLALAASSQAVEFATATSQMDVSYTLGANMTVAFNAVSANIPTRAAGLYVRNEFADGETAPQVIDFETGLAADPSRYTASLSGGANGSVFGNRLVLASTASGAFSGKDGDLALFRRYGYRYFLQITNNANDDQEVTFDFNLQRRLASGNTDIPYDLAKNLGQYAESGGVADVVDTAIDDDPPDYNFFRDTIENGSGTDYSAAYTYSGGPSRHFTVPGKGGSIELEIYNSSYAFLEDDHVAAVPEPASMLALGVGTLGLLRRRRR